MKQLITYLLLTGLIIGLAGCRLNYMEPEEMQDILDSVAENIGNSQITDEKDLIGTRVMADGGDVYAGTYTAECESVTGRDVVFGGASIHNRDLFLSGHVETESGKATVRIRMNDEVVELEPDTDGHFETTLKLDNGGNYIMVVYESFTGNLEINSEYLDETE